MNHETDPHWRYGGEFGQLFEGRWVTAGNIEDTYPDPYGQIFGFINRLGFELREHHISLIQGTIPPFPNFSYKMVIPSGNAILLVLGASPIPSLRSAIFSTDANATLEAVLADCEQSLGWHDCLGFQLPRRDRIRELEEYERALTPIALAKVAELAAEAKKSASLRAGCSTRHPSPEETIALLERIARRLPHIAHQLGHRHDDRSTLCINDEYDVQDLVHALLQLFFEDIRAEEWTPSYAGGSSRIDFLLQNEQTVLEMKKTRPGLKAKELSEQLMIDIMRYQSHPNCKALVGIIYDLDKYVSNPKGVERDLSKPVNGMPVSVFIVQG